MSEYNLQIQTNEGIIFVKSEIYNKYKHDYFVGEDGIRYGHKDFSKMILPKEVLIEAIKKWSIL